MSHSLNRVTLIGNLTGAPESRSTQGGTEMANFTVACNESWKDKNTGEKKESAEFIRCVAFGPLAEIVSKYAGKGDKILVEGKFTTRKWQDKDGQDRWSTEVTINAGNGKIVLLGGNKNAPAQDSQRQQELDDDIPF